MNDQFKSISIEDQNKSNQPVLQPPPVPPKNINRQNSNNSTTSSNNNNSSNNTSASSSNDQISNNNNQSITNETPIPTTPAPTPTINNNDHVKRQKKPKYQRMNESEARRVLANMVTPGDPLDKYDLKDKLGSGAAGEVYRAINRRTQAQVAIKRMILEKQQRKDMIVTEIQVMKEMHFPSIVNYIECYFYEKELWIVMEYLEGGALTDIVLETVMDENQMATVTKECLLALDYLHSHNIIHRDMKI